MTAHGSGVDDNDPIVVFEGAVVGVGPDLEPLVIPRRVIAWIRGKDLDPFYPDYDPFERPVFILKESGEVEEKTPGYTVVRA
jgi:hypothetical protein